MTPTSISSMSRTRVEPTRSQRGFTIVEMTVSIVVMMEIILGALLVFDFNSKLARVQGQLTDMQQNLRIGQFELVRFARMAGRGGLGVTTPSRLWPKGAAIEVRNNVTSTNNTITLGDGSSPTVVLGTDVLTVRGVFTGQILSLNIAQAGTLTLFDSANNPTPPSTATKGSVQVCSVSPSGMTQDLATLQTEVANPNHEAVVLRSSSNDAIWSVVELTGGSATASLCAGNSGVTINFIPIGDVYANAYQLLSPVNVDPISKNPTQNMPTAMTGAITLGVLEEYRYYIRQEFIIPGNAASGSAPRLTRARYYPGTEKRYNDDATNLQMDVAEDVLDLQVALGLDVNNDGAITDTANGTDEYLYNSSADDVTQLAWQTVPGSVPAALTQLMLVRINLLARTSRQDTNYAAVLIPAIEDHIYSTSPPAGSTTELNSDVNRMFRRRLLQTIVSPRGAV
jgi:type II secretory pathway pseudopilin PulG